jgi:hypothetical protein
MRLNAILLALIALAVFGIQVLDRGEAAVEQSVRRYAIAVSTGELDAAMAEIAPDQRSKWVDWVRSQLGNVYYVRGIAVRSASLVQTGRRGPFEVTAVLDVNRDYPDEFYQPTARVPVKEVDGHWYLATPLLASE